RCRDLLDLDADPAQLGAALSTDPVLAPLVAARPGLRIPGAVDGFEIAVRAVLGQQISVAAARTLTARLVQRFSAIELAQEAALAPDGAAVTLRAATGVLPGQVGSAAELSSAGWSGSDSPAGAGSESGSADSPPSHFVDNHPALNPFPRAETLAAPTLEAGDFHGLGLTRRTAATLRALAAAVAAGDLVLDRGVDRTEARAKLLALPGIGPWTADYIALRVFGDPDAFPVGDLVLRRQAESLGLPGTEKALLEHAERWRPWRAYAALHLWACTTTEGKAK
ncbi:MAG: DNA-3-methyladenine glycosylase 2 family protein, partial [Catenulispora sp.]|nr:DNA-3-methyladenine glycosylase 2 family protein [Catenulispora sp.]